MPFLIVSKWWKHNSRLPLTPIGLTLRPWAWALYCLSRLGKQKDTGLEPAAHWKHISLCTNPSTHTAPQPIWKHMHFLCERTFELKLGKSGIHRSLLSVSCNPVSTEINRNCFLQVLIILYIPLSQIFHSISPLILHREEYNKIIQLLS